MFLSPSRVWGLLSDVVRRRWWRVLEAEDQGKAGKWMNRELVFLEAQLYAEQYPGILPFQSHCMVHVQVPHKHFPNVASWPHQTQNRSGLCFDIFIFSASLFQSSLHFRVEKGYVLQHRRKLYDFSGGVFFYLIDTFPSIKDQSPLHTMGQFRHPFSSNQLLICLFGAPAPNIYCGNIYCVPTEYTGAKAEIKGSNCQV